MVTDSTVNIHTRLEERADIIKGLTISDQELREASMFLNPTGTVDDKINSLEIQSNRYRSKESTEFDPRRKQLCKNISETPKLKPDYIRITEKREEPEHQEATKIIKETADDNESIKDLTRLEELKKWAKENLASVCALAITSTRIITTIVMGARKAITKGDKGTGKFAKAVYNIGKKLGPLLAPILNITQAISWGAIGLAWLASNLWVIALGFAWLIYNQYKQQSKK